MSDHQNSARLDDQLAEAGLNMTAIVPVSALDSHAFAALPAFAREARGQQTLLLVGNSGPAFWAACQSARQQAAAAIPEKDPVDHFAGARTSRALRALLAEDRWQLLYPVLPGSDLPPCNISLQALGAIAGWHQPSPLGIGIHATYGLWFAYRALVLLDMDPAAAQAALGVVPAAAAFAQETTSVCAECVTQDCVNTCPAGALASGSLPDMQRCSDFRLGDDSPCAHSCLARNACPVGMALRYTAEQSEYHYSVSLESLKRWKQSRPTGLPD